MWGFIKEFTRNDAPSVKQERANDWHNSWLISQLADETLGVENLRKTDSFDFIAD